MSVQPLEANPQDQAPDVHYRREGDKTPAKDTVANRVIIPLNADCLDCFDRPQWACVYWMRELYRACGVHQAKAELGWKVLEAAHESDNVDAMAQATIRAVIIREVTGR